MVWLPAPVPETASALVDGGFEPRLAAVLARRGLDSADEAERFLAPGLEQLHEPRLLAGMEDAVARLVAARDGGEPVAIVGDYDVDGVSGTALLSAVLRACGFVVKTILPHRMRDGYGFQPVHAERALAFGCGVLITVDCGTNSVTAAERAMAGGLDVVITDHHLPGSSLPAGVLHVNPRQEGCSYPFPDLSGAGLALKLALAVAEGCGRPMDPLRLLRIACLGTIADLVPLRGENRVIASLGLAELERTRSPGLRALIDVSRIRPPYDADDVGYRLGPRLNAPGRLESADTALELLLTRDVARAKELARDLDARNRERQEWERQAAEEARELFLARPQLPPILLGWSEGWHRGVVGIAAGRLARELNRPVLLLAVEGDRATGSGRSISGIHLHDFLSEHKDSMERFGGHAQAVGLTVAAETLPAFREALEKAAEPWAERVATRRYEYEIEIEAREAGHDLLGELRRLKPFGQGNPRPLVRVRGPLRLAAAPRLFGRGHLSAELVAPDRGRIKVLGWGWAERSSDLLGEVELLGRLELDRYTGDCVLKLVDARASVDDRPATT